MYGMVQLHRRRCVAPALFTMRLGSATLRNGRPDVFWLRVRDASFVCDFRHVRLHTLHTNSQFQRSAATT
jgi:hypothetical protein